MTEIHNWSRGSEAPGTGGEFDLEPGIYQLVADMPVALQHRIAYEPAVSETRFGPQIGEHRRRTELETLPAKSTWAPVALDDDNAFTAPADGTYRLTFPKGGKGAIRLLSTEETDVSEPT